MSVEESYQDTSVLVPPVDFTEHLVDQSYESVSSHTNNVESISCPPRRIPRVLNQPILMKDYIVTGKRRGTRYPIVNYLYYNNTTPAYQCYVSHSFLVKLLKMKVKSSYEAIDSSTSE